MASASLVEASEGGAAAMFEDAAVACAGWIDMLGYSFESIDEENCRMRDSRAVWGQVDASDVALSSCTRWQLGCCKINDAVTCVSAVDIPCDLRSYAGTSNCGKLSPLYSETCSRVQRVISWWPRLIDNNFSCASASEACRGFFSTLGS